MNYENTTKPVTVDFTKTMMKKSRSLGGANSELALSLNILFLLLIFIGFNRCYVRFAIACITTIIIVQAIVNEGLLFA